VQLLGYIGFVLILATVAHLAVIWGRNPDARLPLIRKRFLQLFTVMHSCA